MNGDQSRTSATNFRRRSVTANDAIPQREPNEHERVRGRHADRGDHRCRRQHPRRRRTDPYPSPPHPATLSWTLVSRRWRSSTIDHALPIDGQQVETGAWTDVLSPYSGELVGRIAAGGAAEARRALDAAARALDEPLPAHERARDPRPVGRSCSRAPDEAARIISAEAGKPMKAARVEAQRAVSTFTFAAVEARKLAGEVDPDGRLAGRRREARVHAPAADRDRRRDLAVQLPAQPRRAQGRARARRRLPGRAQARLDDAAVRALPRRTSRRRPASRRAG